jgi:phosphoribosylformylglycinamidine synthase
VKLWEGDIYPAEGQPDLLAETVVADAADLGIAEALSVCTARGYLIQGRIDRSDVELLAKQLLADAVVEETVVAEVRDPVLCTPRDGFSQVVHVLLKPGVMDPVAQSARSAIADFEVEADEVRTLKKFWLADMPAETLDTLCNRLLANDAIEQVVVGPLEFDHLQVGTRYQFELVTVPIRELTDEQLADLSLAGQL